MNAIEQSSDTAPIDLDVMRQAVRRLLEPGPAAVPADDELVLLTEQLRGHVQLIIPVIERIAGKQPKDSVPRYCTLACVGEARRRLSAQPSPRYGGALGYARRLARVLSALCEHHEKLAGELP
ncbi:DUF6415 family natural product biosynthesis protein [Streptomyces sp. HMX87]|uniref:DUF6415 family natural product biosynthesis protein n=1 Tax=Streptomyces sp. HMX87 TaxID=3390849 RepID=UPI003A8672B1